MSFFESKTIAALERLTTDLLMRIQHLEGEQGALRARLEGDADLRRLTAGAAGAAQTALAVGEALERFAAAMRASRRRGWAGGRARAAQARRFGERWSNGRYMAHEDWEHIEREVADADYMRHAAGGFARAAGAPRNPDGTFAGRTRADVSI